MAKLQKSIQINAPVEKVFNYLQNPENLPEIWPSLIEVKDVQRTPGGEFISYKWTYKMAGMRFEGTTELTESIPNQRAAIKDSGGIQGTRIMTFESQEGGMLLTVDLEYIIPVPLLGKLAEPFILRQNVNEADTFLANLKARMES
jgi:uncharacterized membrane protein